MQVDVQRNGAGATLPLEEVVEAEAPSSVQAVFDEIRDVLRVPFVDQIWRVLAREPEFLPRAWGSLAPLLGSKQAERAADDLRREAAIPLAIGLPAHKAFRGDMSRAEIGADDRDRISNFTMAMHYVLPKLLLAAALLEEKSTNPVSVESSLLEPLPRGVAPGAPRVNPIDPATARGETVGLFAEIRSRHGYQPIADYYRTIAMAGDFLRLAWNALRPVVGDPEYFRRARAVTARARTLAASFPRDAAPAPLDVTPLLPAIGFYLEHLLPETLVELTVVKGLMDGPRTAAYNRYSLTDTQPDGDGP
jgi:Halocarboxylic acid dehydrogenase DehI